MSYNNPDQPTFQNQPLPSHHQHASSDALPGEKSLTPGADHSSGVLDEQGIPRTNSAQGDTAFTTDRPSNVKPSPAGGVAIDGREDLPEGKATVVDKIVGKAQKVTGKYTHNPELHEKGELRESGGKAAVTGEARAPHD